jgi:hypothetical protein
MSLLQPDPTADAINVEQTVASREWWATVSRVLMTDLQYWRCSVDGTLLCPCRDTAQQLAVPRAHSPQKQCVDSRLFVNIYLSVVNDTPAKFCAQYALRLPSFALNSVELPAASAGLALHRRDGSGEPSVDSHAVQPGLCVDPKAVRLGQSGRSLCRLCEFCGECSSVFAIRRCSPKPGCPRRPLPAVSHASRVIEGR